MKNKAIWTPAFICMICISLFDSLSQMILSFMISSYALDLGVTQALAATLVSVLSISSLIMRPIAGKLVDSLNNKRLLLASLCGSAVSLVLYILANGYWTLMLARLLHGICIALSTLTSITIAGSLLPEDHLGSGIAYYGMGNAVCVVFATKIGQSIYRAFGARMLFATGIVCVAIAFVLTCLLPKPAPKQKKTKFQAKDLFRGLFAKEAVPFGILHLLFSGSQAINSAFMVLYFTTKAANGISVGDAGTTLMIWGIAIFVFRPLVGKIIDRFGPMPAAILCMSGSTAYTILLGLTPNIWVTYLGTFFFGGFGGSSATVLQAAAYACAPIERKGVANSTNLMGGDIGTALGAVLIGRSVAFFTTTAAPARGYQISYLLCALPLLLAIGLCMVFHRRLKKRTAAPML